MVQIKYGKYSTASTSCTHTCTPSSTTTCTTSQHIPQLKWSHYKPEFSGKSEEDAEAHLFRTNNWIDTHQFQEGVKVQRFCLTLVEARLWYESLRHINVDWKGLQNQFRQHYVKIGNTREHLFHA